MNVVIGIALAVHALAAVLLVGGLFFSLLILRPSAQTLDHNLNLTLWRDTLSRFLPRGWIGIALLLLTGHGMVRLVYSHLSSAPSFVRAMLGLAVLLTGVFAYVQFVHWRRFARAVQSAEWTAAERFIRPLRLGLTVMLVLGLLTVLVGSAGRYFA